MTKRLPGATKALAVKKKPSSAAARELVLRRQWSCVDFWRSALRNIDKEAAAERRREEVLSEIYDDEPPLGSHDNPALDALQEQWDSVVRKAAETNHQVRWLHAIRDLPELEKKSLRSSYLLDVIVNFVTLGMYPPPEYLLALSDTLGDYYASNGKLTLEETIFGPPMKRIGNHAANSNKRSYDAGLLTYAARIAAEKGLSNLEAAEKVMEDLYEGEDIEKIQAKAHALLHRNPGRIKTTKSKTK